MEPVIKSLNDMHVEGERPWLIYGLSGGALWGVALCWLGFALFFVAAKGLGESSQEKSAG
jgi:hypothetical protein